MISSIHHEHPRNRQKGQFGLLACFFFSSTFIRRIVERFCWATHLVINLSHRLDQKVLARIVDCKIS
jgi:hypothetical protein